jgi:hypothetical protein
VKGQSNYVIAGSPRNAYRCSVACFLPEVEHWLDKGAYKLTEISQTPNAGKLERGSETVGDKLHSREGNSPDHQLRPLRDC